VADYTDRPGYSFDPGPPPEASRFLKNKGLRPAFSWRDVEPEEHAVAFTVAKAMQIDVLTTIREEVQKALDEGLPLETFQKNLKPRLVALGWWGRKEMADPLTGELVEARLGSPRRLRTIYNANLRSARAAGQWERIERTKKLFPYLEYRLGPSERHRPHHAIKEGLVIPVDDPFWDEWMPPNGWGCKCWVKQVTRAEAERKGVDPAPQLIPRKVLNKRTGEMREVPPGIDPGWERNPGKLRLQNMEQLLDEKLAAAPPDILQAAVRDIATSWRAERVLDGKAPGAVPVAVVPQALASELGTETSIVHMTSSYGDKFEAKGRGVDTGTLLILDEALQHGTVIREDSADGKTAKLHVISRGEPLWRFVLKLIPARREIWISTMHRMDRSRAEAILARPGTKVVRE